MRIKNQIRYLLSALGKFGKILSRNGSTCAQCALPTSGFKRVWWRQYNTSKCIPRCWVKLWNRRWGRGIKLKNSQLSEWKYSTLRLLFQGMQCGILLVQLLSPMLRLCGEETRQVRISSVSEGTGGIWVKPLGSSVSTPASLEVFPSSPKDFELPGSAVYLSPYIGLCSGSDKSL